MIKISCTGSSTASLEEMVPFQGMLKELSEKNYLKLKNQIIRMEKTEGDVMDIFMGSGSTLIACEKTNRKCYGMEIDPHYIDVIVKRYSDFTHKSDNIYLERDGEKTSYQNMLAVRK